ncbi:MAG: hypothetical protein JW829_01920 [Pirellulales bacterium]|nr:hypothetical protein [Pirellulales bacterium]
MRSIVRRSIFLLFVVVGVILLHSSAVIQAEVYMFTLDPAQSVLTSEMYLVPVNDFAIAQDTQNTSISTSFSGTIAVELNDSMNPTTIQILWSNALAAVSGNWLPEVGGGTEGNPDIDGDADPGQPAPAAYGWYYDAGYVGKVYSAARDIVLSVESDSRILSGNLYDALQLSISVPQGVYHANVSSSFFGDDASTDDLTDEVGVSIPDVMDGSFLIAGDQVTLTIPLNFVLGEGSDVEVTFTGELVGRAPYPLAVFPPGDFDLDADVDGADFLIWQKNFGLTGTGQIGTGDANGDNAVDGVDLSIWATNFGTVPGNSTAGIAATPEPNAIAIALFLGLTLISARRFMPSFAPRKHLFSVS